MSSSVISEETLCFFVTNVNGDLRELTMSVVSRVRCLTTLVKTVFNLPKTVRVVAVLESTGEELKRMSTTITDAGLKNGCLVQIVVLPSRITARGPLSFVGVNLCKRVHPELLELFYESEDTLTEHLNEMVDTFMTLNNINRCILHLAKAAGVVSQNKYNFHSEGANPQFVATMRRLLIDLRPEFFYTSFGYGPIKFDEVTETRKMSLFLNHLLTSDKESNEYVEALRARSSSEAGVACD